MSHEKKTTADELYHIWLEKASETLRYELEDIADDAEDISDRFFQPLAFGTGGLRGVIGAGTNRMNIHTVGLATQALADWLGHKGSVAIARDSRSKSKEFSEAAACVLAANGITVHFSRELQPTPVLSYAVRKLGCSGGIVITASHNPAIYNGYKCYGPDGGQMTDDSAHQVEACMARLDIFTDVKTGGFDGFAGQGLINYIDDDFIEGYLDAVQSCQVEPEAAAKAGLRVVYTPLCGAGNKPVRAILRRIGVTVEVVAEQENPDGNFPRCPFPNPQYAEAFDAARDVAEDLKKNGTPADLLLATDPDCDRVGIAVRDGEAYTLMSGDEVGALMLDYLLSRRKENGTLSERPVAVKSIVTSAIADKICAEHGCELRACLTGFKYIGEIITNLETAGEAQRFVMGYEESYGYLAGTYARDKDAVFGAMMICEMASYYKLQGRSLLEVMAGLYDKHGYYVHRQVSMKFEGESGMDQMAGIMDGLRGHKPSEIAGVPVVDWLDYKASVKSVGGSESAIGLPKSNVLEFVGADGSILTARPSGTEPMLKFYFTAALSTAALSTARLDAMEKFVRDFVRDQD